MSKTEQTYTWDSKVEADQGGGFTLLEPGEYAFEVVKFERGHSNNKNCPMAKYTLKVTDDSGSGTQVLDQILLHSCNRWKITQFFVAIGQVAPGDEVIQPKWDCVGATGRCRVIQEEYTGKDGTPRKGNRIERYLEPVADADKW